ncbi:glycosyltransferase family 4 protein [Halobacillus salinus]|uniref:glycosyltransferase family 4 protein n=1 Tax=Halobacillus salinus TaxID=192814 RepID=UPI0009A6AF17|nr:glycosyltransferase family 4 protein [Halobacillus salinus]
MGKILQICGVDETADKLLRPLVMRLKQEGHEVHIACADTGRVDRLRAEGFEVFTIPMKRSLAPVSSGKSLWKLFRLMRREKYDIVHVHTPVAAALGRVAAKMAGIKHIVYTAHGFYFHDDMGRVPYYFWFTIEKWLARHTTDYILLQSKEDYELCLRERFLPEEKTFHLSNGVDIEGTFRPSKKVRDTMRDSLHLQEEERVICFIGRLVKEKGILELLEAFKQVKQVRKNVKLLVIGSLSQSERDQDTYRMLQNHLRDPDVLALGYRNDIHQLLEAADIFVLPSYREGLPRSIIEAMAMEKAVVATDIRGCREEVIDGKTGYLVPKGDSNVLRDRLLRLVDDAALRSSFGKEGRRFAEQYFNERKVLDLQVELFRKTLEGEAHD